MSDYYVILTDAGRALEAAAMVGQTTYTLATCALGDGSALPDPAATALQNEVWRGTINTLRQDTDNPNWLVIETRLAPETGGFTIREVGIYTDDGVLFAVGNFPETYKPTLSEGTGVDMVVRLICEVSNAESVTLMVDPSVVMASRKYVDDLVKNLADSKLDKAIYDACPIATAVNNTPVSVPLQTTTYMPLNRVQVDTHSAIANGVFVVPITGIYHLYFQCFSLSAVAYNVQLSVDNNTALSGIRVGAGVDDGSCVQLVIKLDAGKIVRPSIFIATGAATVAVGATYFSAHMIRSA